MNLAFANPAALPNDVSPLGCCHLRLFQDTVTRARPLNLDKFKTGWGDLGTCDILKTRLRWEYFCPSEIGGRLPLCDLPLAAQMLT